MLQLVKNDLLTEISVRQAEVRQRELDYYSNIYWIWGSAATMQAGFVFDQLKSPIPMDTSAALEIAYVVSLALCLGAALSVILLSLLLTVWGPGLALRGPDGMRSFETAVVFMRQKQNMMFYMFTGSVVLYFLSACILLWVYPSRVQSNLVTTAILGFCAFVFVSWQGLLERSVRGNMDDSVATDGHMETLGAVHGVADLDVIAQRARELAPVEEEPGIFEGLINAITGSDPQQYRPLPTQTWAGAPDGNRELASLPPPPPFA